MPLALKTDIDISTDIDWHRIYISANNRPAGLSAALAWTQVSGTEQILFQILQQSISNLRKQNPDPCDKSYQKYNMCLVSISWF